jgi:hypothetical protein
VRLLWVVPVLVLMRPVLMVLLPLVVLPPPRHRQSSCRPLLSALLPRRRLRVPHRLSLHVLRQRLLPSRRPPCCLRLSDLLLRLQSLRRLHPLPPRP